MLSKRGKELIILHNDEVLVWCCRKRWQR